jgi:hypothetical protein
MLLIYLIVIIAIGGGVSALVTNALIRRDDRRLGPGDDHAEARLQRLEQSMEALAAEMERMSEGQRFLTRVLTERREGGALPPAQHPPEDPPEQPR